MTKHVTVLMGGWSAEREISMVSGAAVAKSLTDAGLEVTRVDVQRDMGALLTRLYPRPDAVFNALHGRFGEDGCVQGLLDILDIPYSHSGLLASALAMDKLATKEILAGHGIPQVSHRGVHVDDLGAPGSDARAALLDGMLADLGPSVFVKPANMGSSIGVSRATDTATLEEALRVAAGYDEWLVVEEAISGREIELAVLGDRVPSRDWSADFTASRDGSQPSRSSTACLWAGKLV